MPRFPGHLEPDPDPYSPAGPAYPTASEGRLSLDYDDDDVETRGIYDYMARGDDGRALRMQPSEDSIEDLNLDDYARLHRATADPQSAYPPFPHTSHVHPLSAPSPVYIGANSSNVQSLKYPPSPDTARPFSARSDNTFLVPPSLVSGTSYDSHDSSTRSPYSVPAVYTKIPQTRSPTIFDPGWGNHLPYGNRSPVIEDYTSQLTDYNEWYGNRQKSTSRYGRSSHPSYLSGPHYSPRGPYRYPPGSATSSPSRGRPVPWDPNDPEEPPVHPFVIKDRMRWLYRMFGGKPGNIPSGERLIGSVDEKGALITVGSKKRVGARWAQGILACGAVISSLYGAVIIKPKKRPPPQSTLPAFVLYAFSIVTLLLVISLWVFRPLCCGKRRKSGAADPLAGRTIILPARGKKNHMQVNFFVDQPLLGQGHRQGDGYDYDWDEFGSQVSTPRHQTRRGHFEGLKLDGEWMVARTFVQRMLFVDIACFVAWAAVFVLILMGKKCPPGTFDGWCDSYNTGTATAFLLSLAFGFSVYFAIVDLYKSKDPPRTRT